MNNDGTLVSVIMPVYNSDSVIQQAIESVLSQSHSNWELLIINDGSNDRSSDVIRLFSDQRIRYFEQENKGVSAARNVGLHNMKGDYFCFLDADDVLPRHALQGRLDVFEKNQMVFFADGKVDYYDCTMTIKKETWIPAFHGNPLQDLLSLSGKCFLGNTWMVKRLPATIYTFREDLTHGEDLLFYLSISKNGGEYHFTTETVLHYRTGHKSAMSNLQGLENGYHQIYEEIKRMDDIPVEWKNIYYKKMKIIMFKSYLGRGELFNALRVIMR